MPARRSTLIGGTQEVGMGVVTAIGIFLLGSAVQLALETSSEVTAETFTDSDVGIAARPVAIATGDIVDISPNAMIVVR
jgi:hypothetical protein